MNNNIGHTEGSPTISNPRRNTIGRYLHIFIFILKKLDFGTKQKLNKTGRYIVLVYTRILRQSVLMVFTINHYETRQYLCTYQKVRQQFREAPIYRGQAKQTVV